MISFDRDFRDVSDNIRFHSAEIDLIANAANISESKKARETEQAARKGTLPLIDAFISLQDLSRVYCTVQLCSDIQRWLSPSRVQDDLYKLQLIYMPRSCDWIFTTPQGQACLSSDSSRTLRVQGRPGTGKVSHSPILRYFVIDETLLSRQPKTKLINTLRMRQFGIDAYIDKSICPLIDLSHRQC